MHAGEGENTHMGLAVTSHEPATKKVGFLEILTIHETKAALGLILLWKNWR